MARITMKKKCERGAKRWLDSKAYMVKRKLRKKQTKRKVHSTTSNKAP
jgi:hypothetical protein